MMVGKNRYRKVSVELNVSPVAAKRRAPLREFCQFNTPSIAARPAVKRARGMSTHELNDKGFHDFCNPLVVWG